MCAVFEFANEQDPVHEIKCSVKQIVERRAWEDGEGKRRWWRRSGDTIVKPVKDDGEIKRIERSSIRES